MARNPTGSSLRQRPPTFDSYAEPFPPYAAVVGVGWATRQRTLRRSAAVLCRNHGFYAVPILDPCGRCGPHAHRRSDRRRQVSVAVADGHAISAVSEFAGLYL